MFHLCEVEMELLQKIYITAHFVKSAVVPTRGTEGFYRFRKPQHERKDTNVTPLLQRQLYVFLHHFISHPFLLPSYPATFAFEMNKNPLRSYISSRFVAFSWRCINLLRGNANKAEMGEGILEDPSNLVLFIFGGLSGASGGINDVRFKQ